MYNTTLCNTLVEEFNTTNNVTVTDMLTDETTSTDTAKEVCSCNSLIPEHYIKTYYGYVSIFICVVGIISNIINTTVLMQKNMITGAINRIILGLAITDLLQKLEFIPFTYYYYFTAQNETNFSYMEAVYLLLHNIMSKVLNAIEISMTLTLAVWRYLLIRYPRKIHIYCSDRRCTLAIFLSYIVPPFLCSPLFVIFTIKFVNNTEDGQNLTLYYISLSQIYRNDRYLEIVFLLYAVFIKLLPCTILTSISYSLLKTIRHSQERKRILFSCDVSPMMLNEISRKKLSKAKRRTKRTTRLLLAVLFFFLLTELPQGIFTVAIGVAGKCLFVGCYQSWGEVMDIIALGSSCINLVLYCSMSEQFRTTLAKLFREKLLARITCSHPDIQMTSLVEGASSSRLPAKIYDKQVDVTTV